MEVKGKTELFESTPPLKAIISLAIPTVISQLIMIAYNMADTFFIGQTGNPNMVAAANLCTPLFILLTAFSNVFGIGGASLMARSLGAGDHEKSARVSCFCIYSMTTVAILYGVSIYVLSPVILPAIGANSATYDFCRDYLFWVLLFGAVPSVLNVGLAHLVRAEGNSGVAGFGMTLGALLNIVLDPILILAMDLDIRGAAIATMFSNLVASLFFVIFLILNRKKSTITARPDYLSLCGSIPSEVVLIGLPSFLMSLLSAFSNMMLNGLIANYNNEAIAGVGIAKKIDLVSFAVAMGISLGVLPLIAYNYSSGNYRRMKRVIWDTLILSLSIASISTLVLFLFAGPVAASFIDDAVTVGYARHFQRIICLGGPGIAVTLTVITIFQAVGKKRQPMFLSMLRKGAVDIPAMLLLDRIFHLEGIVWATPIADYTAMLLSLILFIPFIARVSREKSESKTE